MQQQIVRAARSLPALASLMPLFFTANQERLTECRKKLAAIDAEIEDACGRRDAAITRLQLLGSEHKPEAATDDGFFSILHGGSAS